MQPALAQYLAQIENPYLSRNVLELSPVGFANRIIPYIINIGLVIGVTAFILFLILGGINWITSSGDKAKLELARDKITQALTGLVVLFSFFALVQLLNLGLGVDIGNLGTGPIYSPPSTPTTNPFPPTPTTNPFPPTPTTLPPPSPPPGDDNCVDLGSGRGCGCECPVGYIPDPTYDWCAGSSPQCSTSSCSCVPYENAFEPQLLAHYRLDEGRVDGEGIATVVDSSGNNYTGLIARPDTCNWAQHGICGVFALRATSSRAANVPEAMSSPFHAPSFTLSGWLNQQTVPGPDSFQVLVDNNSAGFIEVRRQSASTYRIVAAVDRFTCEGGLLGRSELRYDRDGRYIPLNEANHFTLTYDSNESRMILYENGREVVSRESISPPQYPCPGARFSCGLGVGENCYRWGAVRGIFDDIRVYNYALGPSEVLGLYEGCTQDRYMQAVNCLDNNNQTRGYLRYIPINTQGGVDFEGAEYTRWIGPYDDHGTPFPGNVTCNRLVGRAETVIPCEGSGCYFEHGMLYQALSCEHQGETRGFFRYVPLLSNGVVDWSNALAWNGPYGLPLNCTYEAGRSNTFLPQGTYGSILQRFSCLLDNGTSRTYRRVVPLNANGTINWAGGEDFANERGSDTELVFGDGTSCNTVGDWDTAFLPNYGPNGTILRSVSCLNNDGVATRGYFQYFSLGPGGSIDWGNWDNPLPQSWFGPYSENFTFTDGSVCNRVEGRSGTINQITPDYPFGPIP